jgi:hypothetical protein
MATFETETDPKQAVRIRGGAYNSLGAEMTTGVASAASIEVTGATTTMRIEGDLNADELRPTLQSVTRL